MPPSFFCLNRAAPSRAGAQGWLLHAACLLTISIVGCGTTRSSDTARSGREQLLISGAVDQAVSKVDFAGLSGRAVYIDEAYLDCVDKKYVVGTIRRQSLAVGARLVDKREAADLVLEIHSGVVGTDRMEQYVGIPGFSAPPPVAFELPDLKLASRTKQTGTVKLGLIAYEPKSGQALGPGGLAIARSEDNNWYVLGVGPFNSGSVQKEIQEVTGDPISEVARQVPLINRWTSEPGDPNVQAAPPLLMADPGARPGEPNSRGHVDWR